MSEIKSNPVPWNKVAVLYGGVSAEREISLKSGTMVHHALCRNGVNAHLFDTGEHDVLSLASHGFDCGYIALHGRFGEDGTVQGAMELMQIPYTGSGVLASSLAMDKVLTKQLWLHNGLSTPQYISLPRGATLDCAAIVDQLGLPLFVKPPLEGSSNGASKVASLDQLERACQLAWQYDEHALIEQCIVGREFTCAILGSGETARALPLVEICAPDGNYDYENKYFGTATQYLCPAPIESDLAQRMQEEVLKAYKVLGCSGWGRAEILLDNQTQRFYLLEMNTSPGMTDHSLVPMAARATGMSYDDLVLHILSMATCHTVKVDRVKTTDKVEGA